MFSCPDGLSQLGPYKNNNNPDDLGDQAGATRWLNTSNAKLNIIPGEEFAIELYAYDQGDPAFDSLGLFDAFTWDIGMKNIDHFADILF